MQEDQIPRQENPDKELQEQSQETQIDRHSQANKQEYEGFLLYPTYRIETDHSGKEKPIVYLYGRLANGKSFLCKKAYEPYFYIKQADVPKAQELLHTYDFASKFKIQPTQKTDFKSKPVAKVLATLPKEIPHLRKLFEEQGIVCYEADIRFVYRFLLDNTLFPYLKIAGNAQQDETIPGMLVFDEPSIENAIQEDAIVSFEQLPALVVCSLDIETDEKGNLYAITLYEQTTKSLRKQTKNQDQHIQKQTIKQPSEQQIQTTRNQNGTYHTIIVSCKANFKALEAYLQTKKRKEQEAYQEKQSKSAQQKMQQRSTDNLFQEMGFQKKEGNEPIKEQPDENLIIVEHEKKALETFLELLVTLDPDILIGWNIIDFDLLVLQKKCKQYGLLFKIGRNNDEVKVRIEHDFLRDSKIEVPGRIVLDGIQILKSSFVKLDDYRLETAAQSLLGKTKLIAHENKLEKIKQAYLEDPKTLIAYNQHDTLLVWEILKSTKTLELTIIRSQLTGMPLDRVKASVATLDSLYLRQLQKKGIVAYSSSGAEKQEEATGGYVMEPKPGIYQYVMVCDFKSLYPSIIRTFNIDPLTFVGINQNPELEFMGKSSQKNVEKNKEKSIPNSRSNNTATSNSTTTSLIIAPNGAIFSKNQGILPSIIERFWKQRDEAKAQQNQLASYAIKIHMNAIYGVLGNPSCRFYNFAMANAITHFGQTIIKKAAELARHHGYQVIYGDTDSIFLHHNTTTYEETKASGILITTLINQHFTHWIKETYGLENKLELQFEKIYERFVIPYARANELDEKSGAKKRYAGLKVYEKDGALHKEIDITGLEFVRRDWTELAKIFQKTLLEQLFSDKDPTAYIKKLVQEVKEGKHDEMLIYKKAIRKELEQYTKTTPPHVKAARMLEQVQGSLQTNVIAYVITINGPQPVGYVTAPLDYEHYLEKQIKPIADSILALYGKSFDTIVSGNSQASLFDF
ncbi:MAG: DNA polymerase II [Candidatus Woesearchaeota archaeon]